MELRLTVKNKILTSAEKWTEFGFIGLSKVSQTQKDHIFRYQNKYPTMMAMPFVFLHGLSIGVGQMTLR